MNGSTLTLLTRDLTGPNGLAFSPDEKKLYVNDSGKLQLRVFDVKSDGTLTNGRISADLKVLSHYGIPTPEFAKNIAWGDKDYKTLYITTSKSFYRVRLNVAGVRPGT